MKTDEIIELAIQGHASTRDAIRWAMNQEREACAKIVEPSADHRANPSDYIAHEQGIELLECVAEEIRARGQT